VPADAAVVRVNGRSAQGEAGYGWQQEKRFILSGARSAKSKDATTSIQGAG